MTNYEFETNIKNNLEELKIENTEKIAVAVSGGSDSLSLVLALNNLKYNVLAILVNHNLRKEAIDEIKQTSLVLKKNNIKHIVKEWDGKYKKNLEAEARKNRYKLLIETCKESNINILCIGHHIDDQAETFLLNLSRGSGLDGLCAMPKMMIINQIKIIRPMLNLTKQNCRDYLTNLNLKWCEDKSNYDTKYKRNNIRFLLQQIEQRDILTTRIARSVEILQEARECLDFYFNKLFLDKNLISFNEQKKSFVIDKNAFLELPIYFQKILIMKCISIISNIEYKIGYEKVENILNSIYSNQPFKRTAGKCFIESEKRRISRKKILIAYNDSIK